MGLWRQIKRKINENRLAMLRYGLPWSRLSHEQKREIILDVENAFLEGDKKVRFSRGAEGVLVENLMEEVGLAKKKEMKVEQPELSLLMRLQKTKELIFQLRVGDVKNNLTFFHLVI